MDPIGNKPYGLSWVILGFFKIHTCLLFNFSFGLIYFIFFDLASNSTLLPFNYFWNFHLAHSWSTICSGHTVPREMGVPRGEAFLTLLCQIHRWASTWRPTGSFPWSGVCVVKVKKLRHYYYPAIFLTNAVSPINCESKPWWEKLTVKHLFGEPSFSANHNVWFIQFHKTKELQLFLPKGLEVYMKYFQGRGRGCGSLWRLSFWGSWWWSRLKLYFKYSNFVLSIIIVFLCL